MTSFKILATNNGYDLVKPIDDFRRGFGFVMIVSPQKEVLKFFRDDGVNKNAIKYLEYVSMTRYEKLKYWLNYKRGSRGF